MRTGLAVLAVVLVCLLAGCANKPAATSTPDHASSSSSSGPLDNLSANVTLQPISRIGMSGCIQQHTFFPYPVQVFQGSQPRGWSFAPSQTAGPNFVDVFIATNQCMEGNLTALDGTNLSLTKPLQIDFAIPVILPDGFAPDPNVTLELVSLGGFVSASEAGDLYKAWGLEFWYGHASFSTLFADPGGARHDEVAAMIDGSTYTIDSVVTASGGAFDAVYRIWVPQAPGVIGHLQVVTSGATTVGQGQATFRFVGMDTIPPASPGSSHVVTGATVETTWVPEKLGQ